MNEIIEIEIPFWQNPQCHVLTEHQRDILKIYTLCWNNEPGININKLGCICFPDVKAIYIEKQCIRYQALLPQFNSSILKVENSDLVEEYVSNAQKWDSTLEYKKLNHFVIHSHEHQISVIATEFTTELLDITNKNKHIFNSLISQ